MRTRGRDLTVISVAAVICAAVVLTVRVDAVRAAFATPLCLLFPGYGITAAVFVRQGPGTPQTLMLIPALSLAVLALGSLLLNLLPGGLHIGSWTALVLAVTLIGCVVAAARRGEAPTGWQAWAVRPRFSDATLLAVGGVLIVGALVASRLPIHAANALGYTQLWMLSTGTPDSPVVHIGVRSEEQQRSSYVLALSTSGRHATVVDRQLTLEPGNELQFVVPIATPAAPVRVTATLTKSTGLHTYRHVTAVIYPPGLPQP